MPSSTQSLRAPIFDSLVDDRQMATKLFQDWLLAANKAITTDAPLNVLRFGARGNGLADDTQAFVDVTAEALRRGGGTVLIPAGSYKISTFDTPPGTVPISYVGEGDSSIIYGSYPAGAGRGHINVLGSGISLRSFLIDGVRTTPVGLFYNVDFNGVANNDPMAPALTTDSSVWVHGDVRGFDCQGMTFQHSAGYAALLDAGEPGGITDASFIGCKFLNNRPNLFGFGASAAIFGSWTGGLYVNGDGSVARPGRVLRGLTVSRCLFKRGTGNQIWSHVYSLDELHSNFQISECLFEDIGLDGVLIGGVTGGQVNSNVFRRIGYVCIDDTSKSIPRWLPNLNATAIDSSGLVKGVNYQGNSITSSNGAGLDLDGHSDSSLSGNLVRIPYDGEQEFEEDSIAISGVSDLTTGTGTGSDSYGCNLGNTSDTQWGGRNVNISGNTFLNLKFGAVRLYSARDCLVEDNDIVAPDVPGAPPIAFGPVSASPYRRSYGHVIKHNRFSYSPPASAPFVFEDESFAPFTAGEKSYVFGNCPILGASGLAKEFQPSLTSGSPHYAETIWFP